MHGEYKMPGGKLAVIDLEIRDERLTNVRLSGDFFLEPDNALHMIDAALEGLSVALPPAAMAEAVAEAVPATTMMYGISPDAVVMAVRRAIHGEQGT